MSCGVWSVQWLRGMEPYPPHMPGGCGGELSFPAVCPTVTSVPHGFAKNTCSLAILLRDWVWPGDLYIFQVLRFFSSPGEKGDRSPRWCGPSPRVCRGWFSSTLLVLIQRMQEKWGNMHLCINTQTCRCISIYLKLQGQTSFLGDKIVYHLTKKKKKITEETRLSMGSTSLFINPGESLIQSKFISSSLVQNILKCTVYYLCKLIMTNPILHLWMLLPIMWVRLTVAGRGGNARTDYSEFDSLK